MIARTRPGHFERFDIAAVEIGTASGITMHDRADFLEKLPRGERRRVALRSPVRSDGSCREQVNRPAMDT